MIAYAILLVIGEIGVRRTEQDNDPTAHAEILAVREACRILKAPRSVSFDDVKSIFW